MKASSSGPARRAPRRVRPIDVRVLLFVSLCGAAAQAAQTAPAATVSSSAPSAREPQRDPATPTTGSAPPASIPNARDASPATETDSSANSGATLLPAAAIDDDGQPLELALFELDDSLSAHLKQQSRIQTFSRFEEKSDDEGTDERHFSAKLNVFGDLSLNTPMQSNGPRPYFDLGALGLLLTGRLGSELFALGEVAIEPSEAGGVDVDLERLSLRYSAPHFFVAAGRMHVEFGFWNASYHHGRWLQPTIHRPSVVAFEDQGGLFPAHSVGVALGPHVTLGRGELHAVVTLANGRGNIADEVLMTHDTNLAKQVTVSVFHDAAFNVDDLRIGAGFLYDRIAPAPADVRPELPEEGIDEYIGNVHLAYLRDPWTVIAEGYGVMHRTSTNAWPVVDGFVVAGYRIERLMPYLAVEGRRSPNGVSPFFVGPEGAVVVPNFVSETAGLRVDTSLWSALKLEVTLEHHLTVTPDVARIEVNWAFGI